ncbi:hypothetical protein TWF694_002615 [Orbilia ellipsospora]|uniref:Ankyrin repeat protein n=1 Tax=Orbilia ellipsospora TaxID=2528407 RepID=A0AAV9X533_9PEZI
MAAPGSSLKLPVEVSSLPKYLADNKDQSVQDLIKPFAQYEKNLRDLFAKDPSNEVLGDNLLGLVPVYAGQEENIEIRARDLESESELEKSRYLIPLKDEERRKTGEKAVVGFEEFKKNFKIFTEGMFENMDWSNVIVACGSVLVSMLPIPSGEKSPDRLREHYRNPWAPNDINLFIYGLDQEAAIKRMEQIEATVRENVPWKVVCLRMTTTMRIVSRDPYRPIHIILRLYDTVSQILYSEGFDVDSASVAYDGKQVYATPQAVASWMLQCNLADPSRYNLYKSYEHRLYMYRKRGFEIYYPYLQRQSIDPSVYKFPIGQLHGLAKLLFREMMYNEHGPNSTPYQEGYWGRDSFLGNSIELKGDIYGADKKLNAWGGEAQKDRVGYLHRHTAFFGTVAEVVEDCCGACPEPQSKEEEEMRLEDDKTYTRGKLVMKKYKVGEPSAQSHEEWVEMAYYGEDVAIYQAIVDEDVEKVRAWATSTSSQDEKHRKKLSRRDYTGRTPLLLAALTSSPEIVSILINAGAKITPRSAEGRNALHIAAARGNAEIVKLLLLKSDENEEIKEEKLTRKLLANRRLKRKDSDEIEETETGSQDSEDMDDVEVISTNYDAASVSVHTGASSYMEISKKTDGENDNSEDAVDIDDILDINMPDKWFCFTPLHYAIMNGHEEVVKLLVSDFGADILRLLQDSEFLKNDHKSRGAYNKGPKPPSSSILPMNLVNYIPEKKKREDMLRTILKLGATSRQTDLTGANALARMTYSADVDCLKIIFDEDGGSALAAAKEVMKIEGRYESGYINCLVSAILKGDEEKALFLLEKGVPTTITLEAKKKTPRRPYIVDPIERKGNDVIPVQPAELALQMDMLEAFKKCVEIGASSDGIDINVLIPISIPDRVYARSEIIKKEITYLDLVLEKIAIFQRNLRVVSAAVEYEPGTYERWVAARMARLHGEEPLDYSPALDLDRPDQLEELKGTLEKDIDRYTKVGLWLVSKGGKTYSQLQENVALTEGLPPIKEAPIQTDVCYSRLRYSKGWEAHLNFKDIVEGPDKRLKINFGYSESVDDKKMQAVYHDFFKAAWDGDFEKIKAYSSPSWGGDATEPLQFDVQNRFGDTPYTVASDRKRSYELLDFILTTRDHQEFLRTGKNRNEKHRHLGPRNYDMELREPFWHWQHVRLTDLILDENISALEALFRSKGITAILNNTFEDDLAKASKIPTNSKRYRGLKFHEEYEEYKKMKNNKRPSRSVVDNYSEASRVSEDWRDDLPWQRKRRQPLALYAAYYGSHKVYEWLLSDGPEIALREYQKKLEEKVKLDDANDVVSETIELSDTDSSSPSFDLEGSDEDTKRARISYKTRRTRKRKIYLRILQQADKDSFKRWLGVDNPLLVHAAVANRWTSQDKKKTFEERVEHLQNNIAYFVSKLGTSILETTDNSRKITPLLLAGSITNKCAMKALLNLGANVYATTEHSGKKENLLHMMLLPYKLTMGDDKFADTVEDCLDVLPEGFLDWAIRNEAPLCAALGRYHEHSFPSSFVQAGIQAIINRSKDQVMDIRSPFAELPIHVAVRNCTPEEHQLVLDASSPELIISEEANGLTPLDFAEDIRYKAILFESEINLPSLFNGSRREDFRKPEPIDTRTPSRFRGYGEKEEEPVLELRHQEWGTEKSEKKDFQHWKMASIAEHKAVKQIGRKRNLITLKQVNEATKESGKTIGPQIKKTISTDIVSDWFRDRTIAGYRYY